MPYVPFLILSFFLSNNFKHQLVLYLHNNNYLYLLSGLCVYLFTFSIYPGAYWVSVKLMAFVQTVYGRSFLMSLFFSMVY